MLFAGFPECLLSCLAGSPKIRSSWKGKECDRTWLGAMSNQSYQPIQHNGYKESGSYDDLSRYPPAGRRPRYLRWFLIIAASGPSPLDCS